MATHKVKKYAVEATDLSGLKSSRYERLQVSYGTIESGSYTIGDYLVFADVPSRDIIRATVVSHQTVPVSLEVYPGTDTSVALALPLASTYKLSYLIEYVRGSGKVGAGASEGDLLTVHVTAA
jgi:hypothetical protein